MPLMTHEIRVIWSIRFLRIGRDLARRGDRPEPTHSVSDEINVSSDSLPLESCAGIWPAFRRPRLR